MLAASLALAGTACSGTSSSAAPPTKICGKTLYGGAAGMFTYDVWGTVSRKPPMPTRLAPVPAGKKLPALLLRVSPSCSVGATLTVTPPAGLVITNRVLGSDGHPVAVAVQGGSPGPVTLTVTSGSQAKTIHLVVSQ